MQLIPLERLDPCGDGTPSGRNFGTGGVGNGEYGGCLVFTRALTVVAQEGKIA